MKRQIIILLVISIQTMVYSSLAHAVTLKQAYEAGAAANGYDRYVELEQGVTYTGGLLIGRTYSPIAQGIVVDELGCDVRIVGNGAILDLQGEQLCISFCSNRLDISDCIVINGNIRFRGDDDNDLPRPGIPTGSVQNVTFYKPHDYGIRLQGSGRNILLKRNLCVDPIDTGLDFIVYGGDPAEWLPTGTSYAASVQFGTFGTPDMLENWSWLSEPRLNEAPIHHFSFL